MAVKGYKCKNKCSECSKECLLDELIPCSPDCENLTEDGKINIKGCLESGCDEVKYIFHMFEETDQELIDTYGEVADYPYEIIASDEDLENTYKRLDEIDEELYLEYSEYGETSYAEQLEAEYDRKETAICDYEESGIGVY